MLLQRSMHAFAVGYYRRGHRVYVICFTHGSVAAWSAIHVPGWHTTRYPTRGPSSTRSLADVLPVASRSSQALSGASRGCSAGRAGETAGALVELREAAARYHRPTSLGELEISVAPRVPIDKATAQRFAELGVHRLILIPPWEMDAAALEQWVTTVGETMVGQV